MQVMRAAVGAAGGHHPCRQRGTAVPTPQGGSGGSGSAGMQPPFAVTLASPCPRRAAGQREGIWQGSVSCAGRGGQAVGAGEQKEIH